MPCRVPTNLFVHQKHFAKLMTMTTTTTNLTTHNFANLLANLLIENSKLNGSGKGAKVTA